MVLELNPLKWFARPPVKPSDVPQLVFKPDVQSDAEGPANAVESVMSTAPAVPAVPKKKTWLQRAGDTLRKVLNIGADAVVLAEAVEPIVDMAVPQVGSLYNGTVGLFVQAEAAYGSAPGNGAAKLTSALPAILANLKTWADANGFEVVEEDVQPWASGLADSLNKLPIQKKQ